MASWAVVIITLLALWWRARVWTAAPVLGRKAPSRGRGEGITVRCAGRGGPRAVAPTRGSSRLLARPTERPSQPVAHSAALSWKAAHATEAPLNLGCSSPSAVSSEAVRRAGPHRTKRALSSAVFALCHTQGSVRLLKPFLWLSDLTCLSAPRRSWSLCFLMSAPHCFLVRSCEQRRTGRWLLGSPLPLAGFPVRTPRRGALAAGEAHCTGSLPLGAQAGLPRLPGSQRG